MSTCAPHREFLGALADGESDLVPAATIEHVKGCPDCSREVHAHQVLTTRIRAAGDRLNQATPTRLGHPSRGRAGLIASAAAALLLATGGAVAWNALTAPDPVQAAVRASSGSLQVQSNDPAQVSTWCTNVSGRSVPAIQLDGMRVVGARMDRMPSTDIVTVLYVAPDGSEVTVGWLEGQAPAGSGIEPKNVSGHELLLVHAHGATAVVLGASNAAIWETAAAIETTLA